MKNIIKILGKLFIFALLIGGTFCVSYVDADITTNLVAHWKFDDGAGTTALDETANDNDCTLLDDDGANGDGDTPAQWEGSGKVGTDNLIFDGDDDWNDCGTDASLDNVFDGGGTWATWVYFDSGAAEDNNYIMEKFRPTLFYKDTSDEIRFAQDFDDGMSNGNDGAQWSIAWTTEDAWFHIAIVYDASSTANDPTFYIDGDVVAETEDTAPRGTYRDDSGRSMDLGTEHNIRFFLGGKMDDVRIYTRELSESDVEELVALGSPATRRVIIISSK